MVKTQNRIYTMKVLGHYRATFCKYLNKSQLVGDLIVTVLEIVLRIDHKCDKKKIFTSKIYIDIPNVFTVRLMMLFFIMYVTLSSRL